ncbi:unnamed protein product [Adineta steineri]|uniref:Uncharacterized protein n=1 Tax=Adineta steineri TaxID=433720 RepID=A0A815MJU2_9BILA|nr:unnamed protein product [Adineta steineri]CAF1526607.1 unnamed protein product [Adineta steineri]
MEDKTAQGEEEHTTAQGREQNTTAQGGSAQVNIYPQYSTKSNKALDVIRQTMLNYPTSVRDKLVAILNSNGNSNSSTAQSPSTSIQPQPQPQ